jgi:hypothetical protein
VNTPPSVPANLHATQTLSGVNLQWDKSTDNSTHANTLSYNLFISRYPDSLFIMSPMAELATGLRKIPQPGNTSLDNFWHIDSLLPGLYYWSVQAIDNSYAGGPFAPIQTFYVYSGDTIHSKNAPVTRADSISAIPAENVLVPLTVSNFNNIGAVSLRLEYDSTVLSFNNSLTTINSQLMGAYVNNISVSGGFPFKRIMIGWSSVTPVTLSNGSILATVGFHYINGCSNLSFNNISNLGADCEYKDNSGNKLNDVPAAVYYINGLVSSGENGGSITGGSTIYYGQETGSLNLTGTTGSVLIWQKQYNNGSFTDITGSAGQSIYSETPVYTGAWTYRAVVQSGFCSPEFSSPETVIVLTPANQSKGWLGGVNDDFRNPDNWGPPGTPSLADIVEIPSNKPNMPVVKDQGLGCKDLLVRKDAVLTVNPGITFSVIGTLSLESP